MPHRTRSRHGGTENIFDPRSLENIIIYNIIYAMSDAAIKIENISKMYRIGAKQKMNDTFREAMMRMFTAPMRKLKGLGRASATSEDMVWALKDISFEVKRGEVLGVIGRNGAGKSTLLKIISRITEPTGGRIEMRGRVGSLLEVGTGFHPELTGRENIFLNGAIMGMSRDEIKRKFDEMVAFSEIEKFLDTQVKKYSSGMYVRLAFAVAAHLDPEILLVDEVLAVGDSAFQKKCLGKMGDITKEGRTILFVSHNMGAIENLCSKAILISNGKLNRYENSKQVIEYYLETFSSGTDEEILHLSDRKDRKGNKKIIFTDYYLENMDGNRISAARSGMDVVFVLNFRCNSKETLRNVDVGISIKTQNEQALFVLYSSYVGQEFQIVPEKGSFRCHVKQLPLSTGRYKMGARITAGGEEADWPNGGIGYLEVEAGDFYGTGKAGFGGTAPILVNGEWDCREI